VKQIKKAEILYVMFDGSASDFQMWVQISLQVGVIIGARALLGIKSGNFISAGSFL